MFLNKTLLKKMIKHSFRREGLTVGRIYGGLVVAGGNWITWTEDGYVPNWLKAAVMEFTGELPQKECVFRAKKDEPLQYEIADNALYDLPALFRQSRVVYTVTPVVIKGKYSEVRILKQNQTIKMIGINEGFYKAIDLSELGDENAPTGPSSISLDGGFLIYKNEFSAYAFMPLDGVNDITRMIMERIDTIDFSEEGV